MGAACKAKLAFAPQMGSTALMSFGARAAAVGVFALLLGLSEPAAAWCQARDMISSVGGCVQPCITEGVPLHWNRRCIGYSLHERGARDLSDADVFATLERSFATWSTVDCGGRTLGFEFAPTLQRTRWSGPEYAGEGGNANQFEFVGDWDERGYASGAFALTTTWFRLSDGTILDADMEINEQSWGWAICPEAGCTDGNVDLENTLTHELGHFLGMAHTPDDEFATMWACADEGETFKRDLAADDVEGICTVYPADSLPATCDFRPVGGFAVAPGAGGGDGCGCRAGGSSAPTMILILAAALPFVRRTRTRRRRR